MAKTFKLELLAADRPFFVGECEHLIYPAQDGLVGVLPGHESLVTIVSPGEIQYKVSGDMPPSARALQKFGAIMH